jgi:hypothetical protein
LALTEVLLEQHFKNNIDKIAEGVNFFDYSGGSRIGAFNRNAVGQPMSEFFGYKVVGLFQSAADVASSATQDGAAPGLLKFQDTNNDGKITPEDRVFFGNPNPKFTYGVNLAFTYKNFDLTGFIQGSYGNKIINWNTWWIDFWPSFAGQKSTELLYNSWTPTNTSATVPKATTLSNFSTNTVACSYYMEDGSYARLKTIQLGYTLPESLMSKISVKSLRVYVQAVNFSQLPNTLDWIRKLILRKLMELLTTGKEELTMVTILQSGSILLDSI